MENNAMDRRQFLTTTAGIALGGFAASAPAIAQAKTKLRVGYLHTLAVDGQIWTGMERGSFDKEGLELELRQFNTGLEIFQALIGGSLDVLATGAVLSNFPARGQGKVFLINDIEVATAQLWIRSDQGIKSFEDLKGKRIATATGTKLIKGWAEANDYIVANSSEAMEALQKAHYSQTPLADINESFKAQKMFTSHDWKRLYSDGTVTNWLQQSTDFFMANAGIKDFTPASKYFDPSLYLKTIA